MKMKAILLSVLLFCVVVINTGKAERFGAFNRGGLVSRVWLQARLDQPGIVGIQVEGALGDSYEVAHIPRSRIVLNGQLGVVRANFAGFLPSLDPLIKLTRQLGINEEAKKVVIYAPDPFGPARFFQVLASLALKNRTALLDGQLPKLIAEGRLTTDASLWLQGRSGHSSQ